MLKAVRRKVTTEILLRRTFSFVLLERKSRNDIGNNEVFRRIKLQRELPMWSINFSSCVVHQTCHIFVIINIYKIQN